MRLPIDRVRPARSVAAATASLALIYLGACASTQSRPSASARTASFASYAVIDGERRPVPDIPMGDAETIARILDEGKNRNHVMDHLTFLCEEFGARLTGSDACERANEWTRKQFASWGLSRSRLDWWGDIAVRFDRGESTGRVLLPTRRRGQDDADDALVIRELEFTTLSWVRGTDGPQRGGVVRMPTSLDELDRVADRIEGSWVLIAPEYSGRTGVRSSGFLMRQRHEARHEVRQRLAERGVSEPDLDDGVSGRWTGLAKGPTLPEEGAAVTADLLLAPDNTIDGEMTVDSINSGPIYDAVLDPETGMLRFIWSDGDEESWYRVGVSNGRAEGVAETELISVMSIELEREPVEHDESELVLERVLAAGPLGFISSSNDERVWTTAATGWRTREIDDYPVDIEINVRQSDYDFINSRAADGAPIQVEFDLPHTLTAGPIPVYNTIAEIPGTTYPDEVVILSGHLDSWDGPGSQGTVDNGTGTAVTMEAARILMAAGVRPKRTIRFILWTGEEQGLLGSRAYVARLSERQRGNISAVFVDDAGTNTQGGAPAADFMVDYLAAATAPTNGRFYSAVDGEHMNVNIRPTGETIQTHSGSDHAAFNEVGIPGFFWDKVGRADYRAAWHTQHDRLDQAIPEYLIQASTNSAITLYNMANAPSRLPRTPEEAEEALLRLEAERREAQRAERSRDRVRVGAR